MAHPPVFNGPDEFQSLGVAEFMKGAMDRDPMLVFYDNGTARAYAPPGTSWDFLDLHGVQVSEVPR